MKERYYSESLLRSLAYDDDVNGNCDGMIDFTVVDSIGGADVEPVRHGEWKIVQGEIGNPFNNQIVDTIDLFVCSICGEHFDVSEARNYCPNCGARMDGGNK